jgi:hypothetical protein
MARSFVVSEKPGSAAFITAVNALLAALTNPTIAGIEFNVDERQRRNQKVYSGVISYDTGGAALATPFLLSVVEASSMAALKTALDAVIAANPTYFYSRTVYRYLYTSSRDPRYIGLTLYNTTGGASANFVGY